jgi:hypothetical protein
MVFNIQQSLVPTDVMLVCFSRYMDPRTCTNRIEVQNANWDIQMDCLVEVYLDYHAWDCGDGMPRNALEELTLGDDSLSLKNINLVDVFSKYMASF